MNSFSPPLIPRLAGIVGVVGLFLACSDDGTRPNAELEPLVGVWEAKSLSVVNPEDLSQRIDLVEQGASYALSVLSTGQYTAVYDLILARAHEAGNVEVSGDQMTLIPTIPPSSSTSGTYMFVGDTLKFHAVRLLDYDFDGAEELIDIRFAFLPRDPGGS